MKHEVAVLGPAGTFTEKAAKTLYPKHEPKYMESVEDVFEYVTEENGFGVVAVENSLEGSVGPSLEGLMNYDVKINGETILDISLCLMAKEGVEKEAIKLIMSHSHALAQCRRYIKKNYPAAKTQATSSTSEALRQASERDDVAAVGLNETGLRYGLNILDEDVQDEDSQTRFIAISKKEVSGRKSSIIFAVKDEPGALYAIVKQFADNNINMTKIESRPSRKKLGEYIFYVDYQNNDMNDNQKDTLHARIRERTTSFKYLGSY